MTTINAVGNGLSGSTGSGSFVGSVSPVLTGTPTTAQIGFTDTTKGIVGTTAADNAAAGFVGQLISSVVPTGSAVSLTNNMPANVTSISLTAGDWDVFGNISLIGNTQNIVQYAVWCSLSSATLPDDSLSNNVDFGSGTLTLAGGPVPFLRVNVSVTTTVYLSCQTGFSASTVTACGGIYARRVR